MRGGTIMKGGNTPANKEKGGDFVGSKSNFSDGTRSAPSQNALYGILEEKVFRKRNGENFKLQTGMGLVNSRAGILKGKKYTWGTLPVPEPFNAPYRGKETSN